MEIKCDYCGNIFQRDKNQVYKTRKHFCSRECFGKFKSENTDHWSERERVFNDFYINGDIVELYVHSKKHGKKTIIIDREDLDKINFVKWSIIKDHNTFYAIAKHPKTHKNIRLHRVLLNPESNMSIDHVNHNGLDNRKSNLKVCTHYENMQNRLTGSNNTSGYKGVSYRSRNNKFVSRITINKKRVYLGEYGTLEEAIEAIERIKR